MNNHEKWDKYFFDLANTVASNSKCLSRKIGAVLVKDGAIISTGYNGPPKGVPSCNFRAVNDLGYKRDEKLIKVLTAKNINPNDFRTMNMCPRQALEFKSGKGLEWCVAGHAERNTLIQAAKNGISTNKTIMYMNCPLPCSPCLVEIINAGVDEIVCTNERGYYDTSAEWLVKSSGIKTRTFSDKIINSAKKEY